MGRSIRIVNLLNILVLIIGILSISGCNKLSEHSFMSSLNARWTDVHNASVMVDEVDGNIAVIDANGEKYVLTPTRKFDASNKTLSVKMTIIPKIDGIEDVVAETLVRYLPIAFTNSSGSQSCSGTGSPDVSKQFNFKNSFNNARVSCLRKFASEAGMATLKEKIAPALTELKAENVMPNLILYNATTDSNSFRLGLKTEGGSIIWNMGFVRKLNDDEVKQLTTLAGNPRQIIIDRNALIDKTVNELLEYIEKQTGK